MKKTLVSREIEPRVVCDNEIDSLSPIAASGHIKKAPSYSGRNGRAIGEGDCLAGNVKSSNDPKWDRADRSLHCGVWAAERPARKIYKVKK